MKKNRKLFRKMDIFETIVFLVVLVYVVSILFVLCFGFINSLKNHNDYLHLRYPNVFGWPRAEVNGQKFGGSFLNLYFNNYIEMFNTFPVEVSKGVGLGRRYVTVMEMMWNSLVYAVSMSLIHILSQVMMAYLCAKYDFKFNKVFYTTAIIVMMIPIVGSLASEVQIINALNLNDTIIGVCLLRAKYTGIYFLVFYATFKNLSWTYAEAAQIDGAGHLQIFVQIMFPMVISSVFAVFILNFITNWNDYLTPMVFIPNKPTIAYGLYSYQYNSNESVFAPHKLAGAMFTCIPVIILFMIFRNKIMGNVTMGGIKG